MSFINFFGNVVRKKDVYFKYSTDEQWTGEYWIDGKKIYQKTIAIDKNSGLIHNISNYECVISIKSIYYRDDTYGWTSSNNEVVVQKNTVYLMGSVSTAVNSKGRTVYITIQYTKTTN